MTVFDTSPFLVCLPLVFAAGLIDLKTLKIPNKLVLAGLLLFLSTLLLVPYAEALGRIAVAVVSFCILFCLFSFGMIGGGDVKFLPVLLLFVPVEDIPVFMYCLAGGLAVGIATLIVARSALQRSQAVTDWASLEDKRTFPVGFAMAIASLIYLVVSASRLGTAG